MPPFPNTQAFLCKLVFSFNAKQLTADPCLNLIPSPEHTISILLPFLPSVILRLPMPRASDTCFHEFPNYPRQFPLHRQASPVHITLRGQRSGRRNTAVRDTLDADVCECVYVCVCVCVCVCVYIYIYIYTYDVYICASSVSHRGSAKRLY